MQICTCLYTLKLGETVSNNSHLHAFCSMELNKAELSDTVLASGESS